MKEYTGCNNCKYDSKESNEFPCVECSHNRAVDYYEPKTNADRIRNMTDEELAEAIMHFRNSCDCCIPTIQGKACVGSCVHSILKWLQAEVKEGAEHESS
jgi:hypothetical protein